MEANSYSCLLLNLARGPLQPGNLVRAPRKPHNTAIFEQRAQSVALPVFRTDTMALSSQGTLCTVLPNLCPQVRSFASVPLSLQAMKLIFSPMWCQV